MPRQAPEKALDEEVRSVVSSDVLQTCGQSSEKILLVLTGTDWQEASPSARCPLNQPVLPGQKGHSLEQD